LPRAVQSAVVGTARGKEVAQGYHLRNGSLEVDVDASDFGPPGQVRVEAHYRLTRQDIPLLFGAVVSLEQAHVEPVAPYRSAGTS
jgi:hypothetical protein